MRFSKEAIQQGRENQAQSADIPLNICPTGWSSSAT